LIRKVKSQGNNSTQNATTTLPPGRLEEARSLGEGAAAAILSVAVGGGEENGSSEEQGHLRGQRGLDSCGAVL